MIKLKVYHKTLAVFVGSSGTGVAGDSRVTSRRTQLFSVSLGHCQDSPKPSLALCLPSGCATFKQ